MAWCKTAVTPLLTHWSYCSLALSHRSDGHYWGYSLQWRHNECDGISNHQPHDGYSSVYSGADQRKHQSSTSLAFVRGIHRWPVNSPRRGPVTRKMFLFDHVIMNPSNLSSLWRHCNLFEHWWSLLFILLSFRRLVMEYIGTKSSNKLRSFDWTNAYQLQ